jgi:hypothetical protein
MIPLTNDRLSAFFRACEQAIQPNSTADLGAFYHTAFLFGGPMGAQPVRLEDFLRALPSMAAVAQSRGLIGTKLKSLEATPLDEKYSLARVVWDTQVEAPGMPLRHLDTKATYLVMATDEGPRIVCQVDHQDLAAQLEAFRPSPPSA